MTGLVGVPILTVSQNGPDCRILLHKNGARKLGFSPAGGFSAPDEVGLPARRLHKIVIKTLGRISNARRRQSPEGGKLG